MNPYALEAAEKGAAFFNQVYPEWLGKINLETLDLENCYQCALGQVVSEGESVEIRTANGVGTPYVYMDSGFAFIYDFIDGGDNVEWLIEHGFEQCELYTYGDLTDAWIDVIKRCYNDGI